MRERALIYARAGALLAASFDPARLSLSGKPAPVLDGVLVDPSSGCSADALSGSGILVYRRANGGRPRAPVVDRRE